MKRAMIFTLVLCVILCGCSKKLGPGDVLDNDTGKIYSLGDSRDVFDQAFGSSSYNEYTHRWDYLSGMLSVAFDDSGNSVGIEGDSGTNRFSFYNFDFSKPLADIKGRYDEFATPGYDSYTAYFSTNGKKIDMHDAYSQDYFIKHTLFVRNADDRLTGLKAGDYVFYLIEQKEGFKP